MVMRATTEVDIVDAETSPRMLMSLSANGQIQVISCPPHTRDNVLLVIPAHVVGGHTPLTLCLRAEELKTAIENATRCA